MKLSKIKLMCFGGECFHFSIILSYNDTHQCIEASKSLCSYFKIGYVYPTYIILFLLAFLKVYIYLLAFIKLLIKVFLCS